MWCALLSLILLVASVIGFENGLMQKEKDVTELRSDELKCMAPTSIQNHQVEPHCLYVQRDVTSGNSVKITVIGQDRLDISWGNDEFCMKDLLPECSCSQVMGELFNQYTLQKDWREINQIGIQFVAIPAVAGCECYLQQAKAAGFSHFRVNQCKPVHKPIPIPEQRKGKKLCKNIIKECQGYINPSQWEFFKDAKTAAKNKDAKRRYDPDWHIQDIEPIVNTELKLRRDWIAKLKTTKCKCHTNNYIQVVSKDSWTMNNHADQLGYYFFRGDMHSGRPIYVQKSEERPVYSMYWNKRTKAWEVGKTVGGNEPTMKTEENTDQICPADPVSRLSKKWTRKNRLDQLAKWGSDKTLTVKCL